MSIYNYPGTKDPFTQNPIDLAKLKLLVKDPKNHNEQAVNEIAKQLLYLISKTAPTMYGYEMMHRRETIDKNLRQYSLLLKKIISKSKDAPPTLLANIAAIITKGLLLHPCCILFPIFTTVAISQNNLSALITQINIMSKSKDQSSYNYIYALRSIARRSDLSQEHISLLLEEMEYHVAPALALSKNSKLSNTRVRPIVGCFPKIEVKKGPPPHNWTLGVIPQCCDF